ncbi:YDG/SRA domain-containing protein [Ornithobacterium rhinotracheale]|uniref:YDG/SRA domain-containing protein n=1 Tax=Ornithobacterium rhinotracheale TaxID=28251 RepID=UPI0040355D16
MNVKVGDVLSYPQVCVNENREPQSLQRGMNFRSNNKNSIILMSTRKNAPYADRVEENGEILIYEGHDVSKRIAQDPKSVDQVLKTPKGTITENGKFFNAVQEYKKGNRPAEKVKVYEKIKTGIWVYNGVFDLIDAWEEERDGRNVFKFKLKITDEDSIDIDEFEIEHNRLIPTSVKVAVWKRDKGRCVKCGDKTNLHFDHILPYSKGGSSITEENIQLLCAKHNLSKSNKII